jgi:hypothetical protein
MLRVQVEGEAPLVAPALQVHEAVALAGRMALVQGQSARFGEDAAEKNRLVVH